MQTFMPYPSLKQSIMCLDPTRLGNQVYRECVTLIRGGWYNHPASKMWRGYEPALALYAMYGVQELLARGFDYRDRDWCRELCELLPLRPLNPNPYTSIQVLDKLEPLVRKPQWIGDDAIHSSHRGVLLYKNYEWYSQFGWCETPRPPLANGKMDYVWPEVA